MSYDRAAVQPAPLHRPPARRTGLAIGITVLAVAILAAGAVLVWVVASYNTQPAADATTTARGTLTLGDGQFVWNETPKPSCSGYKASADLGPGTQVTVTSAAGVVLALGSIDDDLPIMGADNKAKGCQLSFTVNGIPRGRGPYGVQFGQRSPLHVNEVDLPHVSMGIGEVL